MTAIEKAGNFMDLWTPKTQKVMQHADVVKPFVTFTVIGAAENGRGGKPVAAHYSSKRDDARDYVKLQREQGSKHEFLGNVGYLTARMNSTIARSYLEQLPKQPIVKQQASKLVKQPKAHRREQQLKMGF